MKNPEEVFRILSDLYEFNKKIQQFKIKPKDQPPTKPDKSKPHENEVIQTTE